MMIMNFKVLSYQEKQQKISLMKKQKKRVKRKKKNIPDQLKKK